MDLIFFDLDGTLLNESSVISPFTKETLCLLKDKNIAYTVATGRTMLSARTILQGHDFDLPQIYTNGVTIWDPLNSQLTLENLLTTAEIEMVVDTALRQGVTPFVHAIDPSNHFIYHAAPQHRVERELIATHYAGTEAKLLPLEVLPKDSQVTNISMIGSEADITNIWKSVNYHPNLVTYSGPAIEGESYRWMDIHHCLASKGAAVNTLKKQLGASNIICFGDGDNDLSMFQLADESYAPQNAREEVKEAASAVIGHNHKDGIAHFLRERFAL